LVDMQWSQDPLVACVAITLLVSLLCILVDLYTKNVSQVDRLWSILPVVYALTYFWKASVDGHAHSRLSVMMFLVVIWGTRLSYNLYRKGGYNLSSEDYRYEVIRKKIGSGTIFIMFDVFFICIFQPFLILAFTLPIDIAYRSRSPFNFLDGIACMLMALFVLGETVADRQQWQFQLRKRAFLNGQAKGNADCKNGFYTHGLFQFSRHPNFFCEISTWWSFYLFSVAASGQLINWTVWGAVALTFLFQGSTFLTEQISLSKYPKYALYKQTTSRLIPWFPGSELDDKAE